MLDPELPEERREQITSEARTRIESGGQLKHDSSWGMRKLAYEIRQRTEADYRFFRFETHGELLDELDHNLRIADGVLRFRIFKVDPRSPAVVPPAPVASTTSAPARGSRRQQEAPARDEPDAPAPEKPEAPAREEPDPAPRKRPSRRPHPSLRPRRPPHPSRGQPPLQRPRQRQSRPRHRRKTRARSHPRPPKAAPCAFPLSRGGRERAASVLRLGSRSNESRKVLSEWPPPI